MGNFSDQNTVKTFVHSDCLFLILLIVLAVVMFTIWLWSIWCVYLFPRMEKVLKKMFLVIRDQSKLKEMDPKTEEKLPLDIL